MLACCAKLPLHDLLVRVAPPIGVSLTLICSLFVAGAQAGEIVGDATAQSSQPFVLPAPPPAKVDLRQMHYGNPAAAPPKFKVDLPPALNFPEKSRLLSQVKRSAREGQHRFKAPDYQLRKSDHTSVATIRAGRAADKSAFRVELPPQAVVRVPMSEVVEHSPVALELRRLLEPALKTQKRLSRKYRKRGRKWRAARQKRLRVSRERRRLAEYYQARRFVPLWHVAGRWTDGARSALTRLGRASDDALQLGLSLPDLAGAENDYAKIAKTEFELSKAVVRYAQYARIGKINPLSVSSLITVKRQRPAPQDVLDTVSKADFAGDALRSYNPQHAGYIALRAKLAELRGADKPKEFPKIAFGRTLRVGMRDSRVPLIRMRFGLMADDEARANLYDTKVASAVKRFQRSRGLAANGKLSRSTIRALSRNNRGRLMNEISANMERWRWLPSELGQNYIMVNVPEYRMRMVRDGREVHSARVIVGKSKTKTPVFSDVMRYIVVNPYWNVPLSIIKNEMLPAFEKDPTYFSRRGYEVKDNGKRLIVRQPPGPRNALGYVKFLFPNRHAVYLHDTPGRHKFRYSRRALSHGCVRVQDPFKLAGLVLSGQSGWSEKRLRRMIGGKERTIRLKNKLPIHIVYFTASIDENGELLLRKDLYGHSRRLQRLMGLRG